MNPREGKTKRGGRKRESDTPRPDVKPHGREDLRRRYVHERPEPDTDPPEERTPIHQMTTPVPPDFRPTGNPDLDRIRAQGFKIDHRGEAILEPRDRFAMAASEADIEEHSHYSVKMVKFRRSREAARYHFADAMLRARRAET